MNDDGHATDLTLFQLDILALHAEDDDYGLGIKRGLEDYYGQEVNHGRLYPTLDDLVEKGLVEKSELDKRTNEYELTTAGRDVIQSRAGWLHAKIGITIEEEEAVIESIEKAEDAARTDGGDDIDDDRTLGGQIRDAAEGAGLFGDDGGEA